MFMNQMKPNAKKVLIVDDDPGIQDAFRLLFLKAGYDTRVLSSGNSILDGLFDIPDIFILDKQLSGVDGLDVCRYLKRREDTRHIPVIIISATPDVARLAADACADGFLEKPFRNRDLLAIVETHLNHSN